MKLAITSDQADELSEQGMQAYVNWCVAKGYEVKSEETPDGEAIDHDVPLWGIGEMIFYLYEAYGMEWPSLLRFKGSGVSIAYQGTPMLCDDLWAACKELLERQT